MIEVRGLCAGYGGDAVLEDVSCTMADGEVLALLGPNGSGKSTLLRTVLGLQKKLTGGVSVDGTPAEQLSAREMARRVAYLPQSRVTPDITARRMVLHGRFPYLSYPRHYRKEDYEAARRALERTDAAGIADRSVKELSGGQRQKVYLAMALAQETKTVLMDEPTTYLDIRHQMEVMSLARELAGQGKCVALVLHDICLAMRCADRVLVLADGRVQMDGDPERVFASGVLDRVFGISLRRVAAESGWQYYCAAQTERRES